MICTGLCNRFSSSSILFAPYLYQYTFYALPFPVSRCLIPHLFQLWKEWLLIDFHFSIVLSSLSFNMEHEQANNSRVEEQTPKKSFCGPVTGGDNFLQKALPSNPDQTVPLRPLGVNATPSSHANNREGRRNSSESGNRSEETTAKVRAKSTKGWMLCCEWSNSSFI